MRTSSFVSLRVALWACLVALLRVSDVVGYSQELVYPNVSNASKGAECMDFENKEFRSLV